VVEIRNVAVIAWFWLTAGIKKPLNGRGWGGCLGVAKDKGKNVVNSEAVAFLRDRRSLHQQSYKYLVL